MTTHFVNLAQRAAKDGSVSSQELLALRQQGWGDGAIHRDEAEALFVLNDALHSRDEAWCDFFVEAIREYVLNSSPPKRQCSEQDVDWLIAQIDRDKGVESYAELEALVRILEVAENTPTRLKHYTLAVVEKEVLSGTGPLRQGGDLSATHITSAEARVLRRVIFASGGHGPAAVSRFDAEMLFRLKDSTLTDENAPEWDDLFVDGVANYLNGFTLQNAQLDHERKRELEAFIADNKASVGGFFARMVKETPKVANSIGVVFGKKSTEADYTRDEVQGTQVTQAEQDWLTQMIEKDGEVDELESRLLARIATPD